MRINEEFQGGNALLCMPRDLFEEAAAHSASSALLKQHEQPEEMRNATQGFGLSLTRPCLHHQITVPPAYTSSEVLIVANESSAKSNTCLAAGSASGTMSRRWNFQVIASLRPKRCTSSVDVISAIDFDETGSRFATGGIARKIRICSYASLINEHENSGSTWANGATREDDLEEERSQLPGPHGIGQWPRSQCRLKRKKANAEGELVQNHDQAALRTICTPAKLSSLKWRPMGSNVVGCGDYDGVVTEWDVEQGLCLSERYEHCGQRIWSVDYSSWFPALCASASGDGTVRLWTLNCERSVGVIRSPKRHSICCAEFSSVGLHQIALACADSNIYVYDVRRLDTSLLCLQGHERAASYARFLGNEELVSASIDSTVKVWDVTNATSCKLNMQASLTADLAAKECKRNKRTLGSSGDGWRLRKTFDAHRNGKNFVGLSVWKEGGLIASGSESDQLWVYERSSLEPVWCMKFPSLRAYPRQRQGTRQSNPIPDYEDGMYMMAGRGMMGVQEEEERRREASNCFVGAVCWREQCDHLSLLSANSQGIVQLVKVWPNHGA